MSRQIDSYTKGIFDKFHRYAAWPPNTKLRLGDIGILESKLFHYRSNLEAMGIHFTSRVGEPIDLDHSSGCTIALNASASGQAIAAGSTGNGAAARISFASSGAFVFQARGCREHEIENKLKLANELARLYHEKRWDAEWVVIESLYEVEKATIIVANSNDAGLAISADASFPAGSVPLANAQGAMSVTSRSGDSTAFIGVQGLTPLFGLLRVKRSFIEKIVDVFVPVSRDDDVLEWLQ